MTTGRSDAPSSEIQPFGITLSFRPGLRTTGEEVVWMTIRQNDTEIKLTVEQAEGLVDQINARKR